MTETEKTLEATVKEVTEATAPDAPKKNAVAAEPSHIAKMADHEDLGAPVVKPTDSNPDATKKTKQVSGDPQQKSQGSADAMPKLKGESKDSEKDSEDKEIKEGELPAGLKKYLDKKDDKKESSDDKEKEEVKEMSHDSEKKDEKEKKEAMHDSEEKKKDKEEGYMKASYKKEEIDVKEHVDALVAGDDSLSEEFKQKAATVFEAAIKSKVKDIAEEIEADYNKKFEEETSKAKDELVEKVDSYLAYVVEEWMKENELALERGIKGEIAEDFISGLKKLFEDHYIDVPDEKYDVLEDQASKIENLEKKLNETIEKNVDLKKQNSIFEAKQIIAQAAYDLADTSKEKFFKLTEEIEYSDAEDFKAKVATIKESYFGKKANVTEQLDDVAAGSSTDNIVDLSNAMAAYTAAISKTKDMKLSIK